VLEPRACAITTLALDHTQILGHTLPEIASEKAGILKNGVPAVCAAAPPGAEAVIEARAEEVGAPLTWVGREVEFEVRDRPDGGWGIEVDVRTGTRRYAALQIPLLGAHQGGNVALAAAAAELFEGEGSIDGEALRSGFEGVRVPARLQRVGDLPLLFIDVAHNEASIGATLAGIERAFPNRRLHVAAGFSKDKDFGAALKPLARRAATLILTSSGSARSAAPVELAAAIDSGAGATVTMVEDLDEAVKALVSVTEDSDVALITGSFYVAGAAMRHLGVEVL
ncbi:MAG: bifunctional folylpolyglutamate synthase/dihydrofolate synthase, partial [Planctomycetota bacterium]